MTQTDQPVVDTQSLSTPARVAWLVLIAGTLYICYFHNLGAIGLVGPDEPRYAWIARDMAETGDWVTPRLYGKPWFEKPVLYYWGAALSFKLFGVSEAAARLPSAISALLATLALAWLALRLYGAETARWLLLLLPTTVGMVGFSHAAAADMPFAGMLTIAMVFAARLLGLLAPSSSTTLSASFTCFASFASFASSTSFISFCFGLFLGLAVLAKGPAAIVLSGGAVLLWALFTRRWRDAFRCLHPVAVFSFCLTTLPWYILCTRRNPDFFRVFIIEHNFRRYLTPEFQHVQPFWFYAPVLLVCFLPWLPLLLWTLYDLGKLKSALSRYPVELFLISWVVFTVIFFSISKSKLPGYILPAVPALGLLLARQVARQPKHPYRLGIAFLVFAVLLFAGAELVHRKPLPHNFENLPRIMTTLLVAEILLVIVLPNWLMAGTFFSSKKPAYRDMFCALAILSILIPLVVWPRYLNKYERGFLSAKTLAEGLHRRGVPTERIFTWNAANRSWRYGASFYLHAEVMDWDMANRQEAFVITGIATCPQLKVADYDAKSLQIYEEGGLWFVCQMTPANSVGGLPGLAGLGGGNHLDDGRDRQPR